MSGKLGMKHRRPRASKSNDKMILSRIENRLLDHGLGQTEMSPTQVMAARAVYDKLRPTLAAVEHTDPDPRDKMTPAELVTRLVAMFDAQPYLLDHVLALRGHTQVTPANDEPAKPVASAA